MSLEHFRQAQQDLDAVNIHHIKATLPLEHVGGGCFEDADGLQFYFHRYGITYLSYHTRGNPNEYARLHATESYDELEEVINADIKANVVASSLIFAVYKGLVVGVLNHYLPVDDLEILQKIDSAGLSEFTIAHVLNEIVFRVYVEVGVGDKHLVSLAIENGHSGHIAFSYSARFMTDSYEFEIPLVDRVRHLGSVSTVLHNLTEIIEAVKELEIDERLRAVKPEEVFSLLDTEFSPSDRPDKMASLISIVFNRKPQDALEAVIYFGEYADQRGYKGHAKRICDTIMRHVFGDKKIA